jgi:hypothetical protein
MLHPVLLRLLRRPLLPQWLLLLLLPVGRLGDRRLLLPSSISIFDAF